MVLSRPNYWGNFVHDHPNFFLKLQKVWRSNVSYSECRVPILLHPLPTLQTSVEYPSKLPVKWNSTFLSYGVAHSLTFSKGPEKKSEVPRNKILPKNELCHAITPAARGCSPFHDDPRNSDTVQRKLCKIWWPHRFMVVTPSFVRAALLVTRPKAFH